MTIDQRDISAVTMLGLVGALLLLPLPISFEKCAPKVSKAQKDLHSTSNAPLKDQAKNSAMNSEGSPVPIVSERLSNDGLQSSRLNYSQSIISSAVLKTLTALSILLSIAMIGLCFFFA